MTILILHTEIMPYGVAILRQLRLLSGHDVVVVRKDQNRSRGYVPADEPGISFLPRSTQSRDSLLSLCKQLDPRLLYLSGWIDADYLAVARQTRANDVPVVTGMDNQWRGDFRQRAACLAARWKVRPFFSHIQVAGPRQYEFARRLGFLPNQILFDLYTCETSVFQTPLAAPRRQKKRFLFVGRFIKKKGLDTLFEAWKTVVAESPDWELQLIGSGDETPDFASLPGIVLSGYLEPEQISDEIAASAVMLVPSCKEPWGVVVHEFAAAGKPMILSSAVGAGTAFLIDGYNGFSFRTGDAEDLADKMRRMMAATVDERFMMGQRSHKLSGRMTPEISAAQLNSLIGPSRR